MIDVLLYSDVIIRTVLMISLGFFLSICCIVLFIICYLFRRNKKSAQRRRLRENYSETISMICVCETSEELAELVEEKSFELKTLWGQNKQARKVFIKELQKVQENLSGQAIKNIVWAYETLGLTEETLSQLRSSKWHRKVAAIQQLATFNQVLHIEKILQETDNKNQFIRDAAQIAIVQLTGFEGLQFLKQLSQPISQWQQVLLLHQLDGEDIEPNKLKEWVQSSNDSVVEFVLRLIEKFRLYECLLWVYLFKEHHNKAVRLQAFKVMKELYDETTAVILESSFTGRDLDEQVIILDVLSETGTEQQIPFLISLLEHQNDLIRYKTLCCLKKIQPIYAEQTMRQLDHQPLFQSILPIVKEQVLS